MLMIHNFFFLSFRHIFEHNISPWRSTADSSWMTSNLLILQKTELLFSGLQQQLAKLQNISLNTTHSACNLVFIFDEDLTFSDQISSISSLLLFHALRVSETKDVSSLCYYHIHQLHCIRPYLDFKTANTIATSVVHSKLNYCNLFVP